MAANPNLAGYDRRLAVVKRILNSQGLHSSSISTLAFDESWKYPFNNYLFKVDLATPAPHSSFPGLQPGTTSASSDDVTVLVVKLSNLTADGLNNANRVENDVAVQHLVRESMAQVGLASLVPDIYAWASATTTDPTNEEGFGWIISEFRDGVDLDSHFSSLGHDNQQHVLEQVATILKSIQTAKLPASVKKFGGLKFDSAGQIVSGEAPLKKGEPVDSYAEWRAAKLEDQLQRASNSPFIQGWKKDDLNSRIEKVLATDGLATILRGVDLDQKSLIHGDFTMNNMLFNKDTNEISAILDFDWSYVCNPFEEFMTCLYDIGGNITFEDTKLEMAILSGSFTQRPADLDEAAIKKWELCRSWNAAMKKAGVISPSEMKGLDKIRDLARLSQLLFPFRLGNESTVKEMGDEKTAELRAKTEADLVAWLEKYGF